MTGGRACMWCGRRPPEVKMSNEHIFWHHLAEAGHIPGAPLEGPTLRGESDGDTPLPTQMRPHAFWESKYKGVCEPCNNHWSNARIDWPAKDALVDLISMDTPPRRLSAAQAKKVATWAVKTLLVFGKAERHDYPDVVARGFRQEGKPPPGFIVLQGTADAPIGWVTFRELTRLNIEDPPAAVGVFAAGQLLLIVGMGADVASSRTAILRSGFPPGSLNELDFLWPLDLRGRPPRVSKSWSTWELIQVFHPGAEVPDGGS